MDLNRHELIDANGATIALRPKAWALLAFMAGQPGRVIERAALLDAVWPDVTVSDDSVTKCVAEVRRALGPHGTTWLRTVARRGYMLDVAVLPADRGAPANAPGSGARGAAPGADHAGNTAALEQERHSPAGVLSAPAAIAANAAVRGSAMWSRRAVTFGLAAGGLVAWGLAAGLFGTEPERADLASDPPEDPREQALRHFRTAVALEETPTERGSNWVAARQHYAAAMLADPEFGPAYAGMLFTHMNMATAGYSSDPEADVAVAESLLEKLRALQPDDARTHSAAGVIARTRGRYGEALQAYARAITLNPSMPSARINLGVVHVLMGQAGQAIERMRVGLMLAAPDHRFARAWQLSLGVAMLHAGVGDFGVAAFRRGGGSHVLCRDIHRLPHLSAALALAGLTAEAQAVMRSAQESVPTLSIVDIRRAAASRDPGYLSERESLFVGLGIVGFG